MHCQGLSTHLRRTGAQVWWRCLGPFPGCTLLQLRARQVHGLHSNGMHASDVRRHQSWRAAASIHALFAGGAPQWWVEGLHAGMSAPCKHIALRQRRQSNWYLLQAMTLLAVGCCAGRGGTRFAQPCTPPFPAASGARASGRSRNATS